MNDPQEQQNSFESPEDFWRNEIIRQVGSSNARIYDDYCIPLHRRMFLEHHKDLILDSKGHPSIQSWFDSIGHDVNSQEIVEIEVMKEIGEMRNLLLNEICSIFNLINNVSLTFSVHAAADLFTMDELQKVIDDGNGSLEYFKEKVLERFKACPEKITRIMAQVSLGVPLNQAIRYVLE